MRIQPYSIPEDIFHQENPQYFQFIDYKKEKTEKEKLALILPASSAKVCKEEGFLSKLEIEDLIADQLEIDISEIVYASKVCDSKTTIVMCSKSIIDNIVIQAEDANILLENISLAGYSDLPLYKQKNHRSLKAERYLTLGLLTIFVLFVFTQRTYISLSEEMNIAKLELISLELKENQQIKSKLISQKQSMHPDLNFNLLRNFTNIRKPPELWLEEIDISDQHLTITGLVPSEKSGLVYKYLDQINKIPEICSANIQSLEKAEKEGKALIRFRVS